MLYFAIYLLGIIIGVIITVIHYNFEKINGVIVVDHKTEQCVIKTLSQDLTDIRKKRAVFYIDHNGKLPRENHSL